MNSMLVTCSTSFFERLLLALRKPCTLNGVFNFMPARSLACASNAMAPISASTLRGRCASICSDSWISLNSTAAMPAGV
jgi:hypothetical protein